jgi:prolipoprotein diacylglyceryl transferase
MFPILQLGPLAIQTPGLILILGLWLGLTISERFAPRYGVPADRIYNLVLTGLVAGVLGARLAYAIRYPGIFADSPLSLFSINPNLLDATAGAGLGLIAAWVYGQRKRLQLWPTLDALTPGLALFAVALGISHLASGAAFGAPTGMPWGIELWGALRHPTQIYETLLGLLIFWVVVMLARSGGVRSLVRLSRPGALFLVYLALSASARLILEAFRGDSALLAGSLRSAQVGAWLVLALSLWGLEKLRSRQEAGEAAQLAEQETP